MLLYNEIDVYVFKKRKCVFMSKLLDKVNSPKDIKGLSVKDLEILCGELREFLVENVSKTGGHLASSLGVCELTVAIHKVFDLPKDKLIWDVGHQSYVHKILTGRKNEFDTLRKYGGISGFPKTKENPADTFNTGHSSTSVSAALGIAEARKLSGDDYNVLAVFGDGAFTGGMMYEAINNAGQYKSKLILILNDNEMSISDNVGAVSKYLCSLRTKKGYYLSKNRVEYFLGKMPIGGAALTNFIKRTKKRLKKIVLPTTMFDDLGFDYIGPIDGHDIGALINILEVAKINPDPVLIHIKTVKGKGYVHAENNPQKFHGVSKFDVETGEIVTDSKNIDYSAKFGEKLVEIAGKNDKVVAITGAMPSGTGLMEFKGKYPERFFDVGIAEQHAVTMGAGLAISGYVPVIPIYSSFFQRAYDQILHDVALQKLHAVFCVDRAGVVGADGETHHGLLDISFMADMPYMSILSPSSFEEFDQMLDYAVNCHNEPISIRYPRGNDQFPAGDFEYGKGKIIREGKDVLIVSSGRMLKRADEVADELEGAGINVKIIALPTILPLDKDLILGNILPVTAVIEDHYRDCGIGNLLGKVIAENNENTYLMNFGFPKEPIIHGSVSELDRHYHLDKESISKEIKEKVEWLKK